jgi:hypothetical protein
MFKYLLIIIINSYHTQTVVLEKFETKHQCEISQTELKLFNSELNGYQDADFNTKCVSIKENKVNDK